jgi:citrate lyase subunit beta/citryl-CoA lyase
VKLVYLFSPADQAGKLEKAAASDADVVLIDLEDGVSVDRKEAARHQASAFLQSYGGRRDYPRFVIRCNPAASPYFADDLQLLRECGVSGVMIPKCEGADEIRAIHDAVPQAELIPLLESAKGVHHVERIAESCAQVRRVAFGAADFALDVGADWSAGGEERKYAMGQIVLLSRVAGLEPPIDAVFPLLNDKEAFVRDAALGRQFGFYGKMIIHPRHIEWTREAYKVPEAELAWCRQAVRLYETGAGAAGAVQLEGKLIDLPVYTKAKRTLLAQSPTSSAQ